MQGILFLRDNNLVDEVKMTFKITKLGGAIVYNKTFNAEWSKIKDRYEVSQTLMSRGTAVIGLTSLQNAIKTAN